MNTAANNTKETNGAAAILAGCYTERVAGYMGAEGFEGSNSRGSLYGAELSKAIRGTLKACRVPGVTVGCHTFSGGQEVTVKVTIKAEDVRPFEECREDLERLQECPRGWIRDPETGAEVFHEAFYSWTGDKQRDYIRKAARKAYDLHTVGEGFGTICFSSRVNPEAFPMFTAEFFDRWNACGRVVSSFNYDRSNIQVDYFDTNFYTSFEIIRK